MPGQHNVSNALSAVAVARHLGMKKGEIREALATFAGVNRRFTKVATVNGATIIDDFGHHPVEIAAVLKAARQAISNTPGARVIAVHQPHRYTRLSNLFEDFCTCFNEADVVAIADVYAAGEDPIPAPPAMTLSRASSPTATATPRPAWTRPTRPPLPRTGRPATSSSASAPAPSAPGPNALPAKLTAQAA